MNHQIRLLFLQVISDGGEYSNDTVKARIAERYGPSEVMKQHLRQDGRTKFEHAVDTAKWQLNTAGLIEIPKRAFARITKQGLDQLAQGQTSWGSASPIRDQATSPPLVPIQRQGKPKIFISYRRKDSQDVTDRIHDFLVDHYGKETVFQDVDAIPPGVDFREHVRKLINQSDVFLVIIGKQWLRTDKTGKRRLDDPRDPVRVEIEAALERGPYDIHVIPVRVKGARFPSRQDVPATIQKLLDCNGVKVRRNPDFKHDMDRLIRAINCWFRNP